MKILICGDRNWSNENKIYEILNIYRKHEKSVEIINGGARGADSIAAKIGKELGFKVTTIKADWKKYSRAAGPIRNEKMIREKPDVVIAFHDKISESKGTKNMIETAQKNKVPVMLIKSDFELTAEKISDAILSL